MMSSTSLTSVFPKNAILVLLVISLGAVTTVATSGEAAHGTCFKCKTTAMPAPATARDKNSSGGAGGAIRTIRVALKPDRESISNAPVTTASLSPSPSPPPPPVIGYTTIMVS